MSCQKSLEEDYLITPSGIAISGWFCSRNGNERTIPGSACHTHDSPPANYKQTHFNFHKNNQSMCHTHNALPLPADKWLWRRESETDSHPPTPAGEQLNRNNKCLTLINEFREFVEASNTNSQFYCFIALRRNLKIAAKAANLFQGTQKQTKAHNDSN